MVSEIRNIDARLAATRELAIGTGAFVAIISIFHTTAWHIVSTWYESNAFNHGFLILPICLYLAWRQRGKATAARIQPDYRGLFIIGAAVASWLLGEATGTLIVEELSLVVIVQGVFITMYGWRLWRVFMFPLLYLFFAVPIGIELVPKLQSITAMIAVGLLQTVGIPVFNDGTIITIPTGTFLVEEECSGVRFLLASIAIGALFAGITYLSWWRRVLFMALSATVPILANGFRAFGIILLTYLTNNEIAHGVDHITYGWIFFTLVTIVILALGMTFRERLTDTPNALESLSPMPEERQLRPVLIAGIVAIVFCAMGELYGATLNEYPDRAAPRIVLPVSDGVWLGTDSVQDRLPPIFASPDIEVSKSYSRDDTAVHLHIGYYVSNRRGSQIVTSEHRIGVAPGWIIAAAGEKAIAVGDKRLSAHLVRSISKTGGHIILYWYWIDGRLTGNPYVAKLLDAKLKVFGGDPQSAIIAIGADYEDNVTKADKALSDFASTLEWVPRTLAEGSR